MFSMLAAAAWLFAALPFAGHAQLDTGSGSPSATSTTIETPATTTTTTIPPAACVRDSDCKATGPCTFARCRSGRCESLPVGAGAPCADGDVCTVDDQCDGAGSCTGAPAPAARDVLNFDDAPAGVRVGAIKSASGAGPVAVYAENARFDGDINAAVLVDSGDKARGNVVVVAESLDDVAPADGLVDRPQSDGDHDGLIDFDFGDLAPVTAVALTVTDFQESVTVLLYNGDGADLGAFVLDPPGEGRAVEHSLGPTRGVSVIRVFVSGAGAIDDVVFERGCDAEPSCSADVDCDDEVFCNGEERCRDGRCVAGVDPCGVRATCMSMCNEGARNCFAPAGTQCEPYGSESGFDLGPGGGRCNAHTCDGTGLCVPGPALDCSHLDGPCSIGACDPSRGCFASPVPDGVRCDDSVACTHDDTCRAGECLGFDSCAPCGFCDSDSQTCYRSTGDLICFSTAFDATASLEGLMELSSRSGTTPGGSLTGDSIVANALGNDFSATGGNTARYEVELPSGGEWYAWGRFAYPALPPSGPNSFFLQTGSSGPLKFGNNKDMLGGGWHWDGDGGVQRGNAAPLPLGRLGPGRVPISIRHREARGGPAPHVEIVCLARHPSIVPTDRTAVASLMAPAECDTCTSAADCDDGDPCTANSCSFGRCIQAPVICDDRDPCTIDRCGARGCEHETVPGCIACSDDGDCPGSGLCDSASRTCTCPIEGLVCISATDPEPDWAGDAGILVEPTLLPEGTLTGASIPASMLIPSDGEHDATEARYTVELPAGGEWFVWMRALRSIFAADPAPAFGIGLEGGAIAELDTDGGPDDGWRWVGGGPGPDGAPRPLAIGIVNSGKAVVSVQRTNDAASLVYDRADIPNREDYVDPGNVSVHYEMLCFTQDPSGTISDYAALHALAGSGCGSP